MNPLYFPFTHMTAPVAAAFARCFEKILIYGPISLESRPDPAPSDAVSEKVDIDLRIPVQGDEEKLLQQLNSYVAWADLHGGALSHFKGRGGEIPFYDENTLSRIRSEIKGMNREMDREKGPKPDPLFTARIFLLMAERFDRQQGELEAGLSDYEGMQKQLMKALKSDDFEEQSDPILPWEEDLGIYATRSRIEAWAQLAQKEKEIPSLWITQSRAAFEQMIDDLPEGETVAEIEGIPLIEPPDLFGWREALQGFLEAALTQGPATAAPSPPEGAGKRMLRLRLHRISGTGPMEALTRLSGAQKEESEAGEENLLIGLLEPVL